MGKNTVQYCLALISTVTVLGNTASFQNANCNNVELSSFLTYTANTLPYIPEHNDRNLNSHPLLCMFLANNFRQCSVFHHHSAYWLKSFGTKGLILMQQIPILWLCTCVSTINYMESTDCILFLYFVDRASRRYSGYWPTWRTLYQCIYFMPLHVSTNKCSSSGGPTCINTSSGITHSESKAV